MAESLQRGRELAQSLVEVVHLREDTDNHNDSKGVCRGIRKLIVSAQRQLKRNAKRFDCHD